MHKSLSASGPKRARTHSVLGTHTNLAVMPGNIWDYHFLKALAFHVVRLLGIFSDDFNFILSKYFYFKKTKYSHRTKLGEYCICCVLTLIVVLSYEISVAQLKILCRKCTRYGHDAFSLGHQMYGHSSKKNFALNFCKFEEVVVLDECISWDNKCVTDSSRDSKQVEQHENVPWF